MDHSLFMAGGGLVKMKGGGGGGGASPKILGSLRGVMENTSIGVWGGRLLLNNWFSVKININFIIKILIPITVTMSRQWCPNNPAHYLLSSSGPYSRHEIFGEGGVIELFVFITRGSRVFYLVYDRYYQPTPCHKYYLVYDRYYQPTP